jgi:type IV pilus assembly protein PilF
VTSGRASRAIGAIGVGLLAMTLVACGSRQPAPDPAPQQPPAQPQPVPASPAERARAHVELGSSYYSIGNFGVALGEFQEALKADPKYVPAHNALGLVYMELKEDDKARASFERALKIDPTDPDTNNNFGLFLCNRGRERDAERYFLAAVRNPLYSTPEDSYVNAGLCARRAGDEPRAQDYFERALQLRPYDLRATSALAQMYFQRRDYARAKTYFARYVQRAPALDARTLWLGVRLEHQLGDRTASRSYGAQLKTRYPDSEEARLFEQGRLD